MGKKASHTMHLPSGKDLTIDLAWPKMTADASDLEFGVTITPDRKVVTKFGWESLRRSLDPCTKSSGPAMVRPPRASLAGLPLWRPMWSPAFGSPLPGRSTDSPLTMTSSSCWREGTDECIFSRFAATKIYKMALRPQKYFIVFHC